jgi:methionine aminotransferase
MAEFRKVHQFNVFSVNTPMQQGIANYLKTANIYTTLPDFFQQKRDYFQQLLQATKFKLLPCKGAYFQCVSYDHMSNESDEDFAKKLVVDYGVAAIPVSAFYTKNIDNRILRFCFAKENSTLEQAVEKLVKL